MLLCPIWVVLKLVKELRIDHPALPIIFLSGYDENHLLELPKTAKHTCILEKPFTVEALSQHIHDLLKISAR